MVETVRKLFDPAARVPLSGNRQGQSRTSAYINDNSLQIGRKSAILTV